MGVAASSVTADVGALFLTIVVLFLPGLLVLRVAGFTKWELTAAPAVTFGCATLAMSLDTISPLNWSVPMFCGVVAVVCLITWLLHRIPMPRWRLPDAEKLSAATIPQATGWSSTATASWALGAAMFGSALFGCAAMYSATGGLETIHQDWDAAFHGMTVRLIHEMGTANLSVLGEVLTPDSPDDFFYPAVWHAVTALGLGADGLGVSRLMNASMVIVPGVAVCSLAGFVRLWSASVPLAMATALFVPWVAAFPFDVLWRGPLIPYAFGVAAVPGICTMMLAMFATRTAAGAWLLGVCAAGLVALHPSTVFVAFGFLIALLVQRWVMLRGKSILAELVPLLISIGLAVPISLPVLLGALSVTQTSGGFDWPRYKTITTAVEALWTDSNWDRDPSYVMGGVLIAGLVIGWPLLLRWIWWIVCMAVFGYLYVIAAAQENDFVTWVTGPWWNDAYRLIAVAWFAAPVVMGAAVVAASTWMGRAVTWVVTKAAGAPQGTAQRWDLVARAVAAASVATSLFAATGWGRYAENVRVTQHRWSMGLFVGPSEQLAYEKFASTLGDNALVLNDPNDGSPWLYTLHGVRTVFPHRLSDHQRAFMGDDEIAILDDFSDIATDKDVQQAIRDRGVTHVMLGTRHPQPPSRPAGLEGIEESEWLKRMPDTWPLEIWQVTIPGSASGSTDTDSSDSDDDAGGTATGTATTGSTPGGRTTTGKATTGTTTATGRAITTTGSTTRRTATPASTTGQ